VALLEVLGVPVPSKQLGLGRRQLPFGNLPKLRHPVALELDVGPLPGLLLSLGLKGRDAGDEIGGAEGVGVGGGLALFASLLQGFEVGGGGRRGCRGDGLAGRLGGRDDAPRLTFRVGLG